MPEFTPEFYAMAFSFWQVYQPVFMVWLAVIVAAALLIGIILVVSIPIGRLAAR